MQQYVKDLAVSWHLKLYSINRCQDMPPALFIICSSCAVSKQSICANLSLGVCTAICMLRRFATQQAIDEVNVLQTQLKQQVTISVCAAMITPTLPIVLIMRDTTKQ